MKRLRRWLRNLVHTKMFHICIIVFIILALITFAYVTILRYNREGETEMPFEVSKINVISSVDGKNVQNPAPDYKWDLNVSQNNDFYIYIEKNTNYNGRTEEAIESVTIDNFEINKNSDKGESKIYKPDKESEKEMFKNSGKNEVENIKYEGSAESKVKNMQMSNQGDLIYFRFTNKNLAEYKSNDEEINYSKLLKKLKIKEEELSTNIKFDMCINLVSGKTFKTTVDTQIPIEGIVQEGTTSKEIIKGNELIFKRN